MKSVAASGIEHVSCSGSFDGTVNLVYESQSGDEQTSQECESSNLELGQTVHVNPLSFLPNEETLTSPLSPPQQHPKPQPQQTNQNQRFMAWSDQDVSVTTLQKLNQEISSIIKDTEESGESTEFNYYIKNLQQQFGDIPKNETAPKIQNEQRRSSTENNQESEHQRYMQRNEKLKNLKRLKHEKQQRRSSGGRDDQKQTVSSKSYNETPSRRASKGEKSTTKMQLRSESRQSSYSQVDMTPNKQENARPTSSTKSHNSRYVQTRRTSVQNAATQNKKSERDEYSQTEQRINKNQSNNNKNIQTETEQQSIQHNNNNNNSIPEFLTCRKNSQTSTTSSSLQNSPLVRAIGDSHTRMSPRSLQNSFTQKKSFKNNNYFTENNNIILSGNKDNDSIVRSSLNESFLRQQQRILVQQNIEKLQNFAGSYEEGGDACLKFGQGSSREGNRGQRFSDKEIMRLRNKFRVIERYSKKVFS
eukprot:TRINITY_DN6784_c0_g3_i2.p1 TRINITY_DN6784_c0_g3~~TRINITY_DN6784_c0_g3_i2.p1  ORF type:complete len:474 (-),score=41.51 TRINITY_DN6784_c0_g3_i2:815-2236(-)